MIPTPPWLLPAHPLSKNAARRLAHTTVVYEGKMRFGDGRVRHVRWLRLDMSYTDRSKYNGDGSLKTMAG